MQPPKAGVDSRHREVKRSRLRARSGKAAAVTGLACIFGCVGSVAASTSSLGRGSGSAADAAWQWGEGPGGVAVLSGDIRAGALSSSSEMEMWLCLTRPGSAVLGLRSRAGGSPRRRSGVPRSCGAGATGV